ncbi:MAG TPA: LysE family translocator [Candidatus Dormibacteraeota bacterium]
MDPRLLAYTLVAALVIVTPGPDMALVMRNVLIGGRGRGTVTALGTAAGSTIWAAASAAGIALLLERSVTAFTVFKLAGAVVLVLLGLRTLLHRSPPPERARAAESNHRRGSAFAQGLAGNLLNPKAGAIFAIIFPQFVRPGDSPWRLLLMLAIFQVLLLIWLNLYSLGIDRLRQTAAAGRVRAFVERATGAVLVGLGLRLAFDRR